MAVSTMVRISKDAKNILDDLAERSGETMTEILNKAIEEYRRNEILRETDRAYADPGKSKAKSDALDAEIKTIDSSLMDELDPNNSWNEPSIQKKSNRRNK